MDWIRWMIRRDIPSVLDIEGVSFESPWGEDDFLAQLRRRSCTGMVVERRSHVVGFMVYELYRDGIILLDFAVCPSVRREGIGRRMIDNVKRSISHGGRSRISLEIWDGNLGGQLFFKSMGFRAIEVLRDNYEDIEGDAYLMEYCLGVSDMGIPISQF